MSDQVITLPPMYPAQLSVFECATRFRVVSKGRRAGGSFLGVIEALRTALQGGVVWHVSPNFTLSTDRWLELKALAFQTKRATVREEPRLITFKGGGSIQVKSAHEPDSLRGSALNLIIVDEAAYVQYLEYLWPNVLRPALATTQGKALFLSSPNGLNYFYTLYGYGLDPLRDDWQAFSVPTSVNPLVSIAEIASMRESMTELEARQEIDAQFVDMSGTVFRRVAENATAAGQDRAIANHSYVIGVDLAKSLDYSVFAVIDTTLQPPELVCLDRQGHVDYTLQVARLKALCGRFTPSAVIVELNNAGSSVFEQMKREGIPNLQSITTTNATKSSQVEALAIAFERDAIRIVPDPVLLGELSTFIGARLPSGLMRYAAAGSNHDDTVLALMIAWAGATDRSAEITLGFVPREISDWRGDY